MVSGLFVQRGQRGDATWSRERSPSRWQAAEVCCCLPVVLPLWNGEAGGACTKGSLFEIPKRELWHETPSSAKLEEVFSGGGSEIQVGLINHLCLEVINSFQGWAHPSGRDWRGPCLSKQSLSEPCLLSVTLSSFFIIRISSGGI